MPDHPLTADSAYDLAVIGLGSAGRSAAELGAALGFRVVAIERDRPGGDCLWTGCIPSKAIIAAAGVAHTMRTADHFGIRSVEPDIDRAAVWARLRRIQAEIAATDDDPDRLRAAGIDVVIGAATIVGPTTVAVETVAEETTRIEARHILVVTGSTPAPVDLGPLDALPVHTPDTFFALDAPPDRLAIVGAGAVGTELAQALARLGCEVTLVEVAEQVLPGEEPELAALVRASLEADGVTVLTGQTPADWSDSSGAAVAGSIDAVLVAVGRRPRIDGLGLEAVGVATTPRGIVVDRRGRTSVPTIAAAGDVTGGHHLTHWAASAATVAVRSLLVRGPAAVEDVVPRCTFTDPELARVGMTIAEATDAFDGDVEVWRHDLAANDRARTDGAAGRIVVVTTGRQRLVGAHILAPGAGEAIGELALAMRDGRRLNHLAGLLHAYPTIASGIGLLAAEAVHAKAAALAARRSSVSPRSNPGPDR